MIAAKQLQSGDVFIHRASTTDANWFRDDVDVWVRALGSQARVLKSTYGVLIHGVRTNMKNIDLSRQTESKRF